MDYKTDALIFGGGVAGLWTLNHLSSQGYNALLVESGELGRGQTIATQGIIHGGGKYLLFESAGVSSFRKRWSSMKSLKEMPAVWDNHFNSGGWVPNLSDGVQSSDECYLYRSVNDEGFIRPLAFELLSRFALQTPLRRVRKIDAPTFLAESARSIYSIGERTVESANLLKRLTLPFADRIVYARHIEFRNGNARITDKYNEESFDIHPEVIVLAAGSGNEGLAGMLGIDAKMQRRPLRQAYIGHPELPDFWAHCIDGQKTSATFTTHPSRKHGKVWQVGGSVAESGVSYKTGEFESRVRGEIANVLPGFNLPKDASIGYFDVDRAEPATSEGQRPSGVGLTKQAIEGGLYALVVFPTKLAMAPRLAEEIHDEMVLSGTFPSFKLDQGPFTPRTPLIASYPWDRN